MLRILLAESQSSLRSAMKLNLEQDSGIAFIAEAADYQSLLDVLTKEKFDFILLDWDLPGFQIESLTSIYQLVPDIKLVILGRQLSIQRFALAAGADGFVLKGGPPGKLIQEINSIRSSFDIPAD